MSLTTVFLAVMVVGLAAHAGNIFDDDWAPPAPRKKLEQPPVVAATTKAVTPAEVVPKTDSSETAPAMKAGGILRARHALPDKTDQAKSRKLYREIFAKELADRSTAARRALAAKLLREAVKAKEVATDRFVLLVGVTEAGRDAADLAVVMKAANALGEEYDIDDLRLKSDIALKMSLRADNAVAGVDNCRAGLELVDELVSADDYQTATRFLQAMRPVGSADPVVSQEIQRRLKDVEAIRVASERLTPQTEKLKTSPGDPAANLAVGRFLCFLKNDWSKGVPLLAKAANSPVKVAAALDLANPTDPDAQVEVGNAWWTVAEKESGSAQLNVLQRAVHWYGLALNGGKLAGLAKTAVEKRIAMVPPKFDPTSPLARTVTLRTVLLFRNSKEEEQIFQAVSNGQMKMFSPAEAVPLLRRGNIYGNVGIVVWGANRWRDIPVTEFTDDVQQSLQQFVRNGGDLIMFEQFGAGNLGIIGSLFGLKCSGAGNGAVIDFPPLKARAIDAGYTEPMLKELNFYNSYQDLPEHSVVLMRNDEGKNVAVVVPYGRGRLILFGTTVDPNEFKIVEMILDMIYHYKGARR